MLEKIKILVPLDFSDLSNKALFYAQTIAELFGGTITPFHAYLPISEVGDPYMLGLSGTPQKNIEEMEAMLRERINDIAAETIDKKRLKSGKIAVGNPAHAIVEEAENYDLVVMSTHGRTGFTRFFLGSVSEKVLRISPTPVLIVDKESELKKISKILITTDFSGNSKIAFPYAKAFARATGAELDLVHILSFDKHDEAQPDESKVHLRKERLKVLAKEEFHEIDDHLLLNVIVSTDTPHEAILNHTLDNGHDLVIMATVGRTGIRYLMMGSTTANIVRHVKCPVLSINPKKKESDND